MTAHGTQCQKGRPNLFAGLLAALLAATAATGQPSNDNFENRTVISGTNLIVSGAILHYQAMPGQVLLLQTRAGDLWVDGQTATARADGVSFCVRSAHPPFADNSRAVVVDYVTH
jgi:hypothetical protein